MTMRCATDGIDRFRVMEITQDDDHGSLQRGGPHHIERFRQLGLFLMIGMEIFQLSPSANMAVVLPAAVVLALLGRLLSVALPIEQLTIIARSIIVGATAPQAG